MQQEPEHSRLEVVDTLLLVAHFGCIGKEVLGKEWTVEIRVRRGVDGSCLQSRRGK